MLHVAFIFLVIGMVCALLGFVIGVASLAITKFLTFVFLALGAAFLVIVIVAEKRHGDSEP